MPLSKGIYFLKGSKCSSVLGCPHQHLQVPPFPRTHAMTYYREQTESRAAKGQSQTPRPSAHVLSPALTQDAPHSPARSWDCCPQRKLRRRKTQAFLRADNAATSGLGVQTPEEKQEQPGLPVHLWSFYFRQRPLWAAVGTSQPRTGCPPCGRLTRGSLFLGALYLSTERSGNISFHSAREHLEKNLESGLQGLGRVLL